MAKAKQSKPYKLRFKPTPISRLRHYKTPIKMVGDPNWWSTSRASYKGAWEAREKAVYAYEMDRNQIDPRGWRNLTYNQAIKDNARIDYLLINKWDDYEEALDDNMEMLQEEAEKENAAWDYHHDNFIAA